MDDVDVMLHKPPTSQAVLDGNPHHAALSGIQLSSQALVRDLLVTRKYVTLQEDGIAFDPRFLVFEYLLGMVLRPRQVELVNSLVARYCFLLVGCFSADVHEMCVCVSCLQRCESRILCPANDHGSRSDTVALCECCLV